jgi:hypothetical protein
MAMCMWAGASRNTSDEEYGSGFAVNCTAWVLALAWAIINFRTGGGALVPLAGDGHQSGACC